jgi:hypothetical protein
LYDCSGNGWSISFALVGCMFTKSCMGVVLFLDDSIFRWLIFTKFLNKPNLVDSVLQLFGNAS